MLKNVYHEHIYQLFLIIHKYHFGDLVCVCFIVVIIFIIHIKHICCICTVHITVKVMYQIIRPVSLNDLHFKALLVV